MIRIVETFPIILIKVTCIFAFKKVFDRPDTFYIMDTILPSPVITKVLRIVAVESNNDVCLRLEAIGCLVSPGRWHYIDICFILFNVLLCMYVI